MKHNHNQRDLLVKQYSCPRYLRTMSRFAQTIFRYPESALPGALQLRLVETRGNEG